MSVPVNERTQGKLEVCVKAHDLACYTLKITVNKKIFTTEYQDALTDKDYLERCVESVRDYLTGLGFQLHPEKTRIFPLHEGIEFLGFRFRLTETGKVLMLIRPESVKRQRKKLRRLVQKSRRGMIPREKVGESYAAWRNHAGKGNSHNLLRRMDAYYLSLWRE